MTRNIKTRHDTPQKKHADRSLTRHDTQQSRHVLALTRADTPRHGFVSRLARHGAQNISIQHPSRPYPGPAQPPIPWPRPRGCPDFKDCGDFGDFRDFKNFGDFKFFWRFQRLQTFQSFQKIRRPKRFQTFRRVQRFQRFVRFHRYYISALGLPVRKFRICRTP